MISGIFRSLTFEGLSETVSEVFAPEIEPANLLSLECNSKAS